MPSRICSLALFVILTAAAPSLAAGQPPAGIPGESVAADAPATDPSTQPPLTADNYVPITGKERGLWIVEGTVGLQSLLVVGPLATAWDTALNSPEEWGQSWSGAGKRYTQRLADVAISSTIEAGLGALWGEDPRYIPSGRHTIGSRAGYAIKTVFVAPRPDGRLQPAWGRYAGNVFNNLIENTWLPPSVTTPWQTVERCALGFLGRLAGNAWDEFWPDVQKHVFHK
jgi:hypothetical protein